MVLKGERMQQGDTKTDHVYSLNYAVCVLADITNESTF